jgi:hypothetical protein
VGVPVPALEMVHALIGLLTADAGWPGGYGSANVHFLSVKYRAPDLNVRIRRPSCDRNVNGASAGGIL